jgi:hypothetical protein
MMRKTLANASGWPLPMLALALILTASCRNAREGEIPGEYAAKLDWGESKLVISADHTFKQTVRTNNGATRMLDGKSLLSKTDLTGVDREPSYN